MMLEIFSLLLEAPLDFLMDSFLDVIIIIAKFVDEKIKTIKSSGIEKRNKGWFKTKGESQQSEKD